MDSIILQTGNTTVTDGDVIGRVGFAASSETGTNARLVVAKIEAVAEETFDASNNATEMVFYLAADGAAASKMTLSSAGNLDLAGNIELENHQFVVGKQTGGATRNILGLDDANEVQLGNNNVATNLKGSSITIADATTVNGVLDITDTTDSSDATGDTGALRCEGGASIAKKLYVGTDLDVDGTTNLDAVDIDGAVDLAGELKLTGAFVPGAGLNASTKTTSIDLDLSTGNYFEVTLTNSNTPVANIVFTNAKVGQRFMIRVIQPSDGDIVLDSVADGWDTISINSDTSTDASTVACKWGGGIGPILSTGNGAADLYGFIIRGVDGSAAIDGVIIAQGLAAT